MEAQIETTATTPKKSNKTLLIILLACAVVILAGAAYFVIANYNINSIVVFAQKNQLIVGDATALIFSITPEKPHVNDLAFKSSNPDVVSVDDEGNIQAHNPGTATITAFSEGGDVSTAVEITVKQPVKELNVRLDSLTLTLGDRLTIPVEVLPIDTTDKIVFATSDSSIATIDENGNVHARAVGKTKIMVRCGILKKHIPIEVYIPVEDIFVIEEKFELIIGKSKQIIATVYPDNATYSGIKFSTTSTDITVSQDGLVTANDKLFADGRRTATAYVKNEDGKISKKVTVTIINPYTWKWDEKRSSLNGWNLTARVFDNTIPNCTGFTFTYKIYPYTDKDYKDVSSQVANNDYYAYVYTDEGKWIRVGTFRAGALNQTITVTVNFDSVNINKIAFITSKRNLNGSYNSTAEIKSLICD